MSSFRRYIQFAAVVGLLLGASVLRAAPWAVVADTALSRIATLDFGTTTPTVYGPFLQGQLGSTNNGNLLDVAITPDGRYALLSNYGDKSVYRVNISNPTNPVVTGCVSNGFSAEDIAIAPNGQFALVTDGLNSSNMAIIDLSSFSTSLTYTITSGAAQAVAIAPDNQTVILCDFAGNKIISGALGPTGLVSESVLSTGDNHPINVSISPDGKTVLVANAYTNAINVFQILSPGNVVTGDTPSVLLMPGLRSQSIAFSPAGDRAYVLQNGNVTNMLSWLQINSPGNVSLGGAGIARLLSQGTNSFFGVDTLDVSPDGAWALAGNPGTLETNVLSLVNLTNYAVSSLDASLQLPIGVAFAHTPGFNTQVTTSPTNPAPLVRLTVTCLITVTNSGYEALNPICLDLGFDPDYLAYTGGVPSADTTSANILTWTNVGPLAVSGWTVVTAQFTALCQTLPGTTITVTSTVSTVGSLPLAPQTSSVPVMIFSSILADFDGDGLADPYVVDVHGNWYIWFSGSSYGLCGGPRNFGVVGTPVAADFDGDGLADPAMVVNTLWYIWFSGTDYNLSGGPWNFGVAGLPVAADFDGDGLADPAMVVNTLWYIWLSGSSYGLCGGPWNFGVDGLPVAADFDGDRFADPAMVVNTLWYVWFSGTDYNLSGGPWNFGVDGMPVTADFDGDGLADPAMVVNNNWTFWLSSGGKYLPYQYPFVP